MIYADYNYYTTIYGGSAVSEAEFPHLAAKASAYIDKATFGRASQHADDERLKNCCCELCEIYSRTDDSGGMLKQSESVGNWSYSLNSAAADKTAADMAYSACSTWLPSEWLYRGVARE